LFIDGRNFGGKEDEKILLFFIKKFLENSWKNFYKNKNKKSVENSRKNPSNLTVGQPDNPFQKPPKITKKSKIFVDRKQKLEDNY
jgi:hypothetical protein